MIIKRNSVIAVIDSGVGGLTLLKNLRKKYPNENYIYLADNQYMPYGNKSGAFIRRRIKALIQYLTSQFDIKLIVLACNTASVSALKYFTNNEIPVIGLDLNKSIDKLEDYKILCTKQSAKGYKTLNVLPCSNFASMIEENIFDKQKLIKKIKSVILKNKITEQNIVLGCTHYELISNLFKKAFPEKNFILPSRMFVEGLNLKNLSTSRVGDLIMIATLPTKSYIDKLWQVYNK